MMNYVLCKDITAHLEQTITFYNVIYSKYVNDMKILSV